MSDNSLQPETTLPDGVSSLFNQLTSKIHSLDSQVGFILQAHENEFLHAYRIHMIEIQKEIKSLRQSISQEELKLRRDQTILARESERDWFRNEALRLDKICKDYMKSLEIWKSKVSMLEADKRILEEKIRMLSIVREAKKSPKRSATPSKNNLSLNKSFITESAVTIKQHNDNSGENAIIHLQKELKYYKDCLKKQRSETNGIITRKHQLEDLFLQCVEVAKEDLRKESNEYLDGEGIEKLGEMEKRKILYTLVGKPEICDLIKHYLFRSRRAVTPHKGMLRSSVSTHGLRSHVFSTPKKNARIKHLPYVVL